MVAGGRFAAPRGARSSCTGATRPAAHAGSLRAAGFGSVRARLIVPRHERFATLTETNQEELADRNLGRAVAMREPLENLRRLFWGPRVTSEDQPIRFTVESIADLLEECDSACLNSDVKIDTICREVLVMGIRSVGYGGPALQCVAIAGPIHLRAGRVGKFNRRRTLPWLPQPNRTEPFI